MADAGGRLRTTDLETNIPKAVLEGVFLSHLTVMWDVEGSRKWSIKTEGKGDIFISGGP